MKIQLDTINKTVKVEEQVNLKEFLKVIKKLLPSGEWEQYSLDGSQITYWSYPYVIETWPKYPTYPWYDYTTSGGTVNIASSDYNCNTMVRGNQSTSDTVIVPQGIYCVEIN